MKSRWPWVVLGVLVLLAIGAAAYLKISGALPAEVVELVAEGGEKRLRDPMRPPRGAPRVLVFALDGVGEDELLHAIRGGGAPNIAALLGRETGEPGVYENAYSVPGVLSILPSTTLAAWTSLFTGEPPARTGVPGNEWFVREEMRFYAPAPVTVTEHGDAVKVYTDELLGRAVRVPTLYELANVRAYVSLSQIYRGADLLTIPDITAFGELITAVAQGLTAESTVSQEAYSKLDQTSVESLMETLGEHGLPDLQVVYFPGVDLYTHLAEQPLTDQRAYLREVIDNAIGRILDAYRRQGTLEDTYILFVADHGHTPVLSDDRNQLGTDERDEPPAVLRQAGFRVRPFVLEPDGDEQDYQATLAYQGAFAYVYLADRSSCPAPGTRCDWARAPRLQEDVLPVVRAFDAANRRGEGVPELRGTLDLIFARPPRPPGQDALPFQVWDGQRLVPVGEYLKEHPRPELLELEARLEGLGAGPYGHRAGDVLLLARTGMERPIEERFYFSSQYRSWHGSPTAQDSRIPLVVARTGSTGRELRDRVRAAVGERPSQLDITPLIRALLKRK
ncbi:MAG: alkaline phosphatase family protein [Gemmatimonadetes bacterium]|nr:alkaline phosphatase family protein [Gemmatimonadota bacterium]